MKHSILTYSLLAVAFAVAPLQAAPPADADAAAAKKAEAARNTEAKRKADEERLKAAEGKKKAEEAARARVKRVNDAIADLEKRTVPYATRIEEMKKCLQEPDLQADVQTRYLILTQIIRYTQNPPWTRIGIYNYETAHTELPPAAEAILNDKEFTETQKLFGGIANLVQYYCDYDRFKEAEAAARLGMSFASLNKNDQTTARLYLADVYRYQDRYTDALAVVRDAMQLSSAIAAKKGAQIAFDFGKKEDAAALWKAANDPYEELMFYAKHRSTDDRSAQARAYVVDTKNDASRRFNVASEYCFGDMKPDNVSARQSLAGIAAEKKMSGWVSMNAIKRSFQLGDYPLTLSMCEVYAGSPVMDDLAVQNIQVISLGAVGRKAEAARLAGEYARNDKLKPVDQARFRFYEAILSGKSTDGILAAAKLTRKEEAAVILSAARNCLATWNMSDLAERYSAEYDKYFAGKTVRRTEVKYFDRPIKDITAWREIYPQLDKQYCDIPYRGSMEFLETDVATGDRDVKIDKNAKLDNTLEMTTLCDRYGVHIFLRADDKNARAIEQGFARGVTTEMYFAPGVNQPYTCLGSSPAEGVTFMFDTTYNNKNAMRLDRKNPNTSFRSEVEFTDTDYVLHLFFAWDAFYNKLPASGTDWRYECLAWTPAGGFSWGGSQGIHSASAWGNLRFTLTEKQLNAIRRELIFKTFRNYKTVPRDPGIKEDLFQCWEDPEIGDPEFYAQRLAPLKKELDSYVVLVKADMSDADVAKVYSEALPRWKGLAHEVDELRREYLAERIAKSGK